MKGHLSAMWRAIIRNMEDYLEVMWKIISKGKGYGVMWRIFSNVKEEKMNALKNQ